MASSLYNKLYEINQIKNQKITASNLKTGVNAFGINGTFTSNSNATSVDIAKDRTAYVNGSQVTGTLTEYNNTSINIPFSTYSVNNSTETITSYYRSDAKYNVDNKQYSYGEGVIRNLAYSNITFNTISRLLNVQAVDIKKGSKILDIEGQYDASTEFSGIKMDPVIASTAGTSLTRSIREISGLDMLNGINLNGYFSNLSGLTLVSNINTPNVTSLALLFSNTPNLVTFSSANLYGEEQTGVNCYHMFNGCYKLETIDDSVRFPKVISTPQNMFAYCTNLKEIRPELNITETVVSPMFNMCYNLVNVPNLNLRKNVNLTTSYLFYLCYNLNVLSVDFQYLSIINSNAMFTGVKSIDNVNLNKILTNCNRFYVCSSTFENTSLTSIPQFNQITSIGGSNMVYVNSGASAVFAHCQNIVNVVDDADNGYKPLLQFSSMGSMLYNCQNLKTVNANLNYYLSSLQYMFNNCTNLETVNIHKSGSNYNLLYVNRMFTNCFNLKSVDFDFSYNINFLANSEYMFSNCYNLVNLNLDAKTVYNSMYMFQNCHNLKSVQFGANLDGYLTSTFYNCSNLTSINTNILSKDTVLSPYNMFTNCINLTGDFTMNLNNCTMYNQANCIFKNVGFNDINLFLNMMSSASQYKIYMNYIASDLPNVKSINIRLNDIQTYTNAFSTYYTVHNCPNLTDLNYDMLSTRYLSVYNLGQYCGNLQNISINLTSNLNVFLVTSSGPNTNNYNINITNAPGVSIEFENITSAEPNITVTNVKEIRSLTIRNTGNCNTINLAYPDNISTALYCNIMNAYNVNTITYDMKNISKISSGINMGLINDVNNIIYKSNNLVNIPNHITLEYVNQSNSSLNIVFENASGSMNKIYVTQSNLQNLNMQLPKISSLNNLYIYNTTLNLKNVQFNFANVTEINTFYIGVAGSLNTINLYMPLIKTINNMHIGYCNNLSDESLDNILGILGNVTYGSTKNLQSVFYQTNFNVAKYENLANYNNLIANGWTV